MKGESSYQCSNAAPFFFINVPLLPNRSNAMKMRLIYSARIIVVAKVNDFKRFPRLKTIGHWIQRQTKTNAAYTTWQRGTTPLCQRSEVTPSQQIRRYVLLFPKIRQSADIVHKNPNSQYCQRSEHLRTFSNLTDVKEIPVSAPILRSRS